MDSCSPVNPNINLPGVEHYSPVIPTKDHPDKISHLSHIVGSAPPAKKEKFMASKIDKLMESGVVKKIRQKFSEKIFKTKLSIQYKLQELETKFKKGEEPVGEKVQVSTEKSFEKLQKKRLGKWSGFLAKLKPESKSEKITKKLNKLREKNLQKLKTGKSAKVEVSGEHFAEKRKDVHGGSKAWCDRIEA